MKPRSRLLLAAAMLASLTAGAVLAGDQDPLFVNLTSDDSHRANMAVTFGANQLERGHPLTVFLNDRAVFIASAANSEQFAGQQKMLKAILDQGGAVIVCPMCMKHYGVTEADLMPGFKVGNPDLTGGALFQDGTKTLSW